MRRRAWLVPGVMLLLSACSGGNDDTAPATASNTATTSLADGHVTETVGSAGGVIISTDGRIRVEIPAGALPEDTLVEVTETSAGAAGLEGVPVAAAIYDFRPHGLTFNAPVTVTHSLDAADLGLAADEVQFLVMLHGGPQSWEPISSSTTRSGDIVEVSAQVTHFSGNTVVDTDVVTPFEVEVRLAMAPASFVAEKGSGESIALFANVPSGVDRRTVDLETSWLLDPVLSGEPGDTGGFITCEEVGNGQYIAGLEAKIDYERATDVYLSTPLGSIFEGFGAVEFLLQVVGHAQCTEPNGGTDQSADSGSSLTAGSLSGTLMLESVAEDFVFESPFGLALLPPENGQVVIPESGLLNVARIDEWIKERFAVDPTPEPMVILSQFQADGTAQSSYGRAVALEGNGTRRVITVGEGASHAEFYIFDVAPCDGFPHTCQDATVHGATLGGGSGLDVHQGIREAFALFDGDSITGREYQWFFSVNGEMTLDGDTPPGAGTPEGDPEIELLESGFAPSGQMAVKMTLNDQIASPGGSLFLKTYTINVRVDDGTWFSGSYGFVGESVVVNGLCLLGDTCPPDGSWPGFAADPISDTEILFTFDPIDGNLDVNADVNTRETSDSDSPNTGATYRGGERLPFGTDDLDC